MIVSKHSILAATAVLGLAYIVSRTPIILKVCGFSLLSAGVDAAFNQSLNILNYDQSLTRFFVYTGGILILTSGIGWIAAQTKSESLSSLVSVFQLIIFSVWVPVVLYYSSFLSTCFCVPHF